MKRFRVGLTGGIAAGKSTVAKWLREAGLEVVDADRIVADLYRPGDRGTAAVQRLFGDSYLAEDGAVDHRLLAERIFSDPTARRRLQAAIHPLVRREFARLAKRSAGAIVLEAPLLIEAGFAPDFDLVVTIEAAPETRLQRAVARGLTRDAAEKRLSAQTDEVTRTKEADRVIHNDGSIEELRCEVEALIEEITERACHD